MVLDNQTNKHIGLGRGLNNEFTTSLLYIPAFGECGARYFGDRYSADPNSSGYIVGGSNAVRGSLPWQVREGNGNRETAMNKDMQ